MIEKDNDGGWNIMAIARSSSGNPASGVTLTTDSEISGLVSVMVVAEDDSVAEVKVYLSDLEQVVSTLTNNPRCCL
jgi:hypothetical protein